MDDVRSKMDDVRSKKDDVRRVYDLQGQEVSQPKNGIYIEQRGEKANKRVMK